MTVSCCKWHNHVVVCVRIVKGESCRQWLFPVVTDITMLWFLLGLSAARCLKRCQWWAQQTSTTSSTACCWRCKCCISSGSTSSSSLPRMLSLRARWVTAHALGLCWVGYTVPPGSGVGCARLVLGYTVPPGSGVGYARLVLGGLHCATWQWCGVC